MNSYADGASFTYGTSYETTKAKRAAGKPPARFVDRRTGGRAASAECEGEGLRARVEELDLERPVLELAMLAHELVQALPG